MDRLLKALHLGMGIAAVVAFLGTGLYMRTHFPHAYQATEVIRYQYRANHIYLLFSGLLNVAFGIRFMLSGLGGRALLQRVGSALLLAAPALLLWAFFVEPPHGSPERPLTFSGVVFCLLGIALHAVGVFRAQRGMTHSN